MTAMTRLISFLVNPGRRHHPQVGFVSQSSFGGSSYFIVRQILVLLATTLLMISYDGVKAHLNLFMNESETKRLLGIPGELYYIRDGELNDYALTFNLPIKSDINEIYFDWQNILQTSLSDRPIPYSISLHVSNTILIDYATLSIPREGTVPTKPSVFSVTLRCSGQGNGEVDIRLQVNISILFSSNVTSLDIRRKKICLKDGTSSTGDDPEDHLKERILDSSSTSRPWLLDANDRVKSSGGVFYIGIGCVCGAISLIIIAFIIFYCRSHKTTPDRHGRVACSRQLANPDKVYFRCDTPSNNSLISGGTSIYRAAPSHVSYTELKQEDVGETLAEIVIDRNLVQLMDVVLEGSFGRIHRGVAKFVINGYATERQVLVKTLTAEASSNQVDTMLLDACLTKDVHHDSIASIIAVCFSSPSHSPLVLYLDACDENLKVFLRHCRIADNAVSALQLTYIALQIVRGLHYLHRRRILHRDVAARNCLVNSQLTVRVTDSALSHDLFPEDYHWVGENENRPIKWLALETLTDRQFSTASDMWSCGVTFWELFTLCQQPYADIDSSDMIKCLRDGYRLKQPPSCPNAIFGIMCYCWCSKPEDRPKFIQMQTSLRDVYSALAGFI